MPIHLLPNQRFGRSILGKKQIKRRKRPPADMPEQGELVTKQVKQKRNSHPILAWLEQAFEQKRDKSQSFPFPYDDENSVLRLPQETVDKLRELLLAGRKIEAVRRVTQLTGAGLRVSTDYVDSLMRPEQ